jgi:hypothetical protein
MSAINMDGDALYKELSKIDALVAASKEFISTVDDTNTDRAAALLALAEECLFDLRLLCNIDQPKGETA